MPQKTDAIVISDDDATASSEASCKSPATRPGKKSLSPKRNIKATTVELDDWSDESEDFYETFRKRKASKNKLASSAKRKGKTVAKGRPRKYTKRDRSNAERADDTASDSEPDLEGFEALPQYIRNRRSSFDQNYKALKIGGLRLPPDFSDVDFSDDERLGELEEKPNFDKTGIKPCQPYKDIVLGTSGGIVPASIAQYLREYQIKGVEFLHHKFVYQKGAILGDDMGLGKTVQVAAFLTAAFGKTGDCRDAKRLRKYRRTKDDWYPRALIICPGGLIQNWRNELQRWGCRKTGGDDHNLRHLPDEL
ncbi:hypothetical protein F4780DRAFT_783454 [Xylariomycetidae sp. FL0641]|nr:hypothetical protein F4780DRAFT_783454 [Xylariomycetidae sp. FL0641]